VVGKGKMKQKTICVANQKGGVGKTTTAVNLAHGLATKGKRVLLVDCDPQGQVATFLGLRQESGLFDLLVGGRPLADVVRSAEANGNKRPDLGVLPGDKRSATAQVVLAAEGFNLACLGDALKRAKADYVIFDTSPSVGLLQEAALFASDWLLIPCATDYAATEGVHGIIASLAAMKRGGAQCKLLGVIPTFYDEITKESKATLKQLTYHLGDAVWQPVHRATVLRECAAAGQTIFERAPDSRTAQEYWALAHQVLRYE